jgi:hypothetical protein
MERDAVKAGVDAGATSWEFETAFPWRFGYHTARSFHQVFHSVWIESVALDLRKQVLSLRQSLHVEPRGGGLPFPAPIFSEEK